MNTKEQNQITIRENHAEILISSPKHGNHTVYVDVRDLSIIQSHRWHIEQNRSTYYAQTNIKKSNGKSTTLRMHTLLQEGVVDHIDRNGLNNRRNNLRKSTHSENQANKGAQRNNCSSGYKNVSYQKPKKPHHAPLKKPWYVVVQKDRKPYRFGYYETIKEAVAAANRGRKELFGEYAYQETYIEDKQ